MRAALLALLGLLVAAPLDASTIRAQIARGRYQGPLDISLGVKRDDAEPKWFAWHSLPAGQSETVFQDVPLGSYVMLVSGAEPLQRLAIATGVGAADARRINVTLPAGSARGRITRGGVPLAGAAVELTNLELMWKTKAVTNDAGELAGPSWLDGEFDLTITGSTLRARYDADVRIARGPISTFGVNLPNRVVRGRVVDAANAPVANAAVILRSVTPEVTRNRRVMTGSDGAFAFEGVTAGMQSLRVYADGYLRPVPDEFSLIERDTDYEETLQLQAGRRRTVEVVGADGAPVAAARIVCAVNGKVVSVATTAPNGRAAVATPERGESVVYVFPTSGSLAVRRLGGGSVERVRVPAGTASLEVATLTVDGAPVAGVGLLMRYNGELVPPDVARETPAVALSTGDDGRAHLGHIPPGTYEFWPYRSPAEADALMASATFEAPINVQVVTGENQAIVRFRKRN